MLTKYRLWCFLCVLVFIASCAGSSAYMKSFKENGMKRMIDLIGGIILLCFFASGCAYNVAFKTPDSYQYETTVPLKAGFYMDKTLRSKVYSGRAFGSGIANRWDVPIGDAVHMYAISYLQNGFAGFYEIESLTDKPMCDVLVKIPDINYYMEGQAAHCDLAFVVENSSGKQVFDKSYHADGPSGWGRVFAAGAFAQKSAIRQSTHVVFENIFTSFMNDIRTNFNSWEK